MSSASTRRISAISGLVQSKPVITTRVGSGHDTFVIAGGKAPQVGEATNAGGTRSGYRHWDCRPNPYNHTW